jgi:Holliday junction DNA helicase RuvA
MITFLHGEIVEKHPTRVVVDVGGIGYEVFIPLSSFDKLPSLDSDCRIFIFDYVREDTHKLFGFMTEDERGMFVLLMSISGIGPKLALSALSGLSIGELKVAIADGDTKRLSSISGVGKKVAERMVVELRDKMGVSEGLDALGGMELSGMDSVSRDSVMALISLGYQQPAARKMVASVMKVAGEDVTVADVIKKALGG